MEGILDTESRALEAIDAALPYVAILGQEAAVIGHEAAKSAAVAAGKAIWEWVAGRLTSGFGPAAVQALEKRPDDTDNRQAVGIALSQYLKSNPAALAELGQLLEKAGVTSATQTANVSGGGNVVTQVAGSGNNVSIGATRTGKPPKAG